MPQKAPFQIKLSIHLQEFGDKYRRDPKLI